MRGAVLAAGGREGHCEAIAHTLTGGAKAAHGPAPQSGVRWLPLRAPPGDVDGELALQAERMEALEEQLAEQTSAHAEDIGDMRAQLIDLQEKVLQMQLGEREGAVQPSVGRATVGAKGKRPWSDDLGEHEMVEKPTLDVATTTDDLGLHEAAWRLDAALTDSFRTQSQDGGSQHIRELKLAAMDVLKALGYRHAAGAVGDNGLQDEGHSDAAEGADDGGRRAGTAIADLLQAGVRDDNRTDLDAIMQEEYTAGGDTLIPRDDQACDSGVQSQAELSIAPAAARSGRLEGYSLPELRSRLSKEDHSHEDRLEAIIFDAQMTASAEWKSLGWPLELPRSWYWWGPKRAMRCVIRGALQRDPARADFSFKSETARSSMGDGRPMHRTTVSVELWDDTFYGPYCKTVAEAERAAHRLALDAYSQWISWTDCQR